MKKLTIEPINCIGKNRWQPDGPRVPKTRACKWRGEELEEGRIMAVFKTPDEHVHGAIALSGREGLIIDKERPRAGVEAQQGEEYAKIRLPLDLSLQDIFSRVDSLASELKKATRGIIPM